MSVPLCIYHGNCQDGFGAAWTVRHALGDRVEFYPGIYQNEPPDVTGRDVIIVDFSYKRPVIEAMALKAHSILILDHHKSAVADLGDFGSGLAETPSRRIRLRFDGGASRALSRCQIGRGSPPSTASSQKPMPTPSPGRKGRPDLGVNGWGVYGTPIARQHG
jgi:hypothetical protein